MAQPLTRRSGTILLQGIVAILVGVLLLAAPQWMLRLLLYMVAGFAIVDGALALLSMDTEEHGASRWTTALHGVVGIGVGVTLLVWPAMGALTLIYLVVLWMVVVGELRAFQAQRLKERLRLRSLPLLLAVVPLAFAILIVLRAGTLPALIPLLGLFAAAWGVLQVLLGSSLRGRAAEEA